jgi:putative ATPase
MTPPSIPLAERLRPHSLNDVIGQKHLVGPDGVLRKAIENKHLPSIIFWGSPGIGKTTLANVLANEMQLPFYALSAISSGVKDVREAIARAETEERAILFIDEIHRFNKGQQDALLGAVEKGTITLIGATTENPSFEVNSALLSRCQVYTLESLGKEELLELIHKAIATDSFLQTKKIDLKETDALMMFSGGDARKLLNLLELTIIASEDGIVLNELVKKQAQRKLAQYDKGGEMHYDVISAFIKSIRGSDPNASMYWLARMIQGGEDPKFIARRLLILSSEDIGLANPTALVMATNCFQAVQMIGYPECGLILSQTTLYLATSAKSNTATIALMKANELAQRSAEAPVPLALRNAQTKLMKEMNYGSGYKYAHEYDGNFVEMNFMPEAYQDYKIYEPALNARENEIRVFLKKWKKYNY